jgi:hypothetical protein
LGRVSPVGYIVLDDEGVKWARIIDKNMFILLGALALFSCLRVLRTLIKIRAAVKMKDVE